MMTRRSSVRCAPVITALPPPPAPHGRRVLPRHTVCSRPATAWPVARRFHCTEVAGYERDDGIFMPGHTRCLVDPLTPGLSDQAPVASGSTSAPVPGSAPLPPPLPGGPTSASSALPSTASGRTLPSATTVPETGAAARSSAEAAHSVVRRRNNELILPTGDPTGIDQGNGTFVSPIQTPGDVSNRAY